MEIPEGYEAVSETKIPEGYELVPSSRKEVAPLDSDNTSGWWERFATGAADPIYGLSQLTEESFPGIKPTMDKWNKSLYDATDGFLGRYTTLKDHLHNREKQYRDQLPANEGFDEARLLGNVVTGLAGTKGYNPNSLAKAVGLGAGMGASEPVVDGDDYWMDKAKQMAIGAGTGVIGQKVGEGVESLLKPSVSPAARNMADEGVELTPGQILGGAADETEQKLTSVPFVGYAVQKARDKAQEQFNIATLKDVIESVPEVSERINTAGHTGIKQISKVVDNAYDRAKSMGHGFRVDQKFNDDIKQLKVLVKELDTPEAKRFAKFYSDYVKPKLRTGGITNDSYKVLDSQIGRRVAATNKLEIGGTFKELESILKSTAMRQNPEMATAMNAADLAFAKLRRVQRAAQSTNTQGGIFTPSQLAQADKVADDSAGKNLTAQGEGLMQQRGIDAQSVIGDTVSDSGTAGRQAIVRGITGTMGGGAGMASDPVSTAAIGTTLYGASQVMSNPAVQKAVRNFLLNAPAEELAEIIDFKKLGNLVGSEKGQDSLK